MKGTTGAVRTASTLAAVSVLALGFAGSSARASAWSRPVVLQPNVDMAAAAVDVAAGRTIAAWEGSTGVWAAISGRGGRLVRQRLSQARIANVVTRLLVVNARGDAALAWETRALPSPTASGLPPGVLFVAYRRADGRFGRTHRVASATDGADIAIDRRGEVTIVWEGLSAAHRPAGLYVTHRERDGRYGRTRRLIDHRTGDFALEVDPRGDMALVWTEGGLASPALRCVTHRPGRDFGRSLTLVSTREGVGAFDTGIDASGRVTVVWEGPYDGALYGEPYTAVHATTVDVGTATVGPRQLLYDPGRGQLGETGVRVAVNDRGDAAALWAVYPPGDTASTRVMVARRQSQHSFTSAQTVGTGDVASGMDAAISPNGALVVAWESSFRIVASLATSSTTPLKPAMTVSPAHQAAAAPTAAITPGGKGLVVWQSLGPDTPTRGPTRDPLLLASSRGH